MEDALEVVAAAGRASRYAEQMIGGIWFIDPARYRLLQRWHLYRWAITNRRPDVGDRRASVRAAIAYYRACHQPAGVAQK
jgi:hypothetical protein